MILDQGIVPARTELLASGLIAQSPWFAMELGGKPLSRLLPRDWDGVRDVLLQILDALACGHARGIIHRDLKPGNVLRFDDVWKLTDYGIAVEPEIDEREEPAGTVPYMAPEQIEGDPRSIGPWTDLYALGCLGWRATVGKTPFTGPVTSVLAAHLRRAPPAFHARIPVPPDFEAWLRVALAKSPATRFQRAADAAWALALLKPPPLTRSAPAPPSRVIASLETLPMHIPTQREKGYVPSAAEVAPRVSGFVEDWRHPKAVARRPVLVGAGLRLFALRRRRFQGREPERDQLWAALHEVYRSHSSRKLAIAGGAGSGKSRLAEWICERSHELGMAHVLRATHHPALGAADGLLAMLERHLRTTGLDAAETHQRVLSFFASRPEPASLLTDTLRPGPTWHGDTVQALHDLAPLSRTRSASERSTGPVMGPRRRYTAPASVPPPSLLQAPMGTSSKPSSLTSPAIDRVLLAQPRRQLPVGVRQGHIGAGRPQHEVCGASVGRRSA